MTAHSDNCSTITSGTRVGRRASFAHNPVELCLTPVETDSERAAVIHPECFPRLHDSAIEGENWFQNPLKNEVAIYRLEPLHIFEEAPQGYEGEGHKRGQVHRLLQAISEIRVVCLHWLVVACYPRALFQGVSKGPILAEP